MIFWLNLLILSHEPLASQILAMALESRQRWSETYVHGTADILANDLREQTFTFLKANPNPEEILAWIAIAPWDLFGLRMPTRLFAAPLATDRALHQQALELIRSSPDFWVAVVTLFEWLRKKRPDLDL